MSSKDLNKGTSIYDGAPWSFRPKKNKRYNETNVEEPKTKDQGEKSKQGFKEEHSTKKELPKQSDKKEKVKNPKIKD
ncbi:hypothetical protein P261_00347 [Lachnospiraceae bacterium TWA4]|nr:hypothetical protein P261_00347 [Lachnospiraceae bacterium TWA4]